MNFMDWLRGKDLQEQEPEAHELRKEQIPPTPLIEPVFLDNTGYIEVQSPTWRYVRNWARESLQKAREKNDNMNRDIIQTSGLRGEVKVLKELMSLPDPKPGKGLLEDMDENHPY